MGKYVFQGPLTNLARFGMVSKGMVLELTAMEAAAIEEDKRFKPIADNKIDTVPPTDEVVKQNQPAQVEKVRLTSMHMDELRAEAAQLEKLGVQIEYRGGATRKALITEISRARATMVEEKEE